MFSVGLLYVGAVLFVNGLMLLDVVPPRSAALLNLFVGGLQCVVPTVLLIQAHNDSAAVRFGPLFIRLHLPVRGHRQLGGPRTTRRGVVVAVRLGRRRHLRRALVHRRQ